MGALFIRRIREHDRPPRHDAKTALDQGATGVVVSDPGGGSATSAPIAMLPAIVDVCTGKAAVLIDGGFRRGSDIA